MIMANNTIALNKTHHIDMQKALLRLCLYFAVFTICVVFLYPYFAMVCTSLKSNSEIFAGGTNVLPLKAMWSNFIDIWKLAPMGNYMLNSILSLPVPPPSL